MAGSDPWLLSGDLRGRAEAGSAEAADAVFRYTPSERAVTYAVVYAERGLLLRYGQSAGAKAKCVLPRLQGKRLCRNTGRYRCGRSGACSPFYGRSAGDKDHHALLRQADHRRHHQTVDRYLHAP